MTGYHSFYWPSLYHKIPMVYVCIIYNIYVYSIAERDMYHSLEKIRVGYFRVKIVNGEIFCLLGYLTKNFNNELLLMSNYFSVAHKLNA